MDKLASDLGHDCGLRLVEVQGDEGRHPSACFCHFAHPYFLPHGVIQYPHRLLRHALPVGGGEIQEPGVCGGRKVEALNGLQHGLLFLNRGVLVISQGVQVSQDLARPLHLPTSHLCIGRIVHWLHPRSGLLLCPFGEDLTDIGQLLGDPDVRGAHLPPAQHNPIGGQPLRDEDRPYHRGE